MNTKMLYKAQDVLCNELEALLGDVGNSRPAAGFFERLDYILHGLKSSEFLISRDEEAVYARGRAANGRYMTPSDGYRSTQRDYGTEMTQRVRQMIDETDDPATKRMLRNLLEGY